MTNKRKRVLYSTLKLMTEKNIFATPRFALQTVAMLFMLMTGVLPSWGIFNPVDNYLYPDNMTMVIQLKDGSQTVDTCEVAAFIDGECRGAARATKGLYFLVIPGQGSGQKVEIRTCLNDEIVTIADNIVYQNDQNLGTPWEPYIIDISDAENLGEKGDSNGDGVVNHADIAFIIHHIADNGNAPSPASSADVNRDGTVDVADIVTVMSVMAANRP